jgi:diguanylate cyclase (GGDEF)-like protein/PAS domain S-box-containing protein
MENALPANEERFRLLYENAPIGIAHFDHEGNWTSVNRKFAQIIGCTPEEAVRLSFSDITFPEDRELILESIHRLRKGELQALGHEQRIVRADRAIVWARVNATFVYDDSGMPHYGIAAFEDVTETRRRRRAEESHKRFEKAFFASPQAMVISTIEHGRILDVSNSFLALMGYSRDDIVGRTSIELGMWADETGRPKTLALLHEEIAVRNLETTVRTKSGEMRDVLLSTEFIELDEESYILTILQDVTEQKKAERQLKEALDGSYYLASHDSLTQLANRAHFTDRLKTAVAHARRDGSRVALHMLDLNQFKSINDTFGHPVGDLLLKEVALRILRHVRETDTAARLGGDEFAVIQTGVKSPVDAELYAKKLTRELRRPYLLDGQRVMNGACLGVAIFPDDSREQERLIKYADAALYAAKKSRQQYWLYASGVESRYESEQDRTA